ncbi:MAG: GIY-YIG nuclease family protein [Patescibacteria group bacterium]
MFYYTYVLKSVKDGELYIGYTSNLKRRILRHNKGHNIATKPHVPYKLIHFEGFLNRIDAKKREVYLKSGWGLKSLRIMLQKYLTKKLS